MFKFLDSKTTNICQLFKFLYYLSIVQVPLIENHISIKFLSYFNVKLPIEHIILPEDIDLISTMFEIFHFMFVARH